MVTPDDVRRVALSLPETEERLTWDIPTFRVRNKIFVSMSQDESSMGFKFPREERTEMIAAEPSKFFVIDGHDDTFNWLRVRLSSIDEDELREIIVDAWRQTAPKRLAASYQSE
jgi:hypothetical protein